MPVKIFFCYAHEDESLLNKLKIHLRPLQRQGLIDVWYDRDISAGTEWEQEIEKHLNSSQIILLLVSPDFINSDYCYGVEMRRAIEQHQRGEARVIPVILRPVSWRNVLGALQALPKDGRPVKSRYWRNIEEALFDVAEGIRKVIETFLNQKINEEQILKANEEQLDITSSQSSPQLTSLLPLHFFWILDCSGSMAGDKVQVLNTALRETIPELQNIAKSNSHARILIRVIKFSSGAAWHIAQPTPIENLEWNNLRAGGVTDMGRALMMVADELKIPPMKAYGLPPVLVLISDGYPTDDVYRGINAIMDQPWGKKAIRIGIGIGADADYITLQRFIGNPELKALQANNPEELAKFIKWAPTVAVQSALTTNVQDSSPSSMSPIAGLPSIFTPPYVSKQSSRQDEW